MRKISPFLILFVFFFMLNPTGPFLFAQGKQDEWSEESGDVGVEGTAQGESKAVAFQEACKNALLNLLEQNLPSTYLKRFEQDIKELVGKNVKKYYTSKPAQVAYDGVVIKISGKVNKEKLLKDVKELGAVDSLEGKLAIFKWSEESYLPQAFEAELKQLAEAAFEKVMSKYGLNFTTQEAIDKRHEQEAIESGQKVNGAEQIFVDSTATQFEIHVKIVLEAKKAIIAKKRLCVREATLELQLFASHHLEKIYNTSVSDAVTFPSLNEDKAKCRELLQDMLGKEALAVVAQIRNYRPARLQESVSTIHFVNFEASRHESIREAFNNMVAKKEILKFSEQPGVGSLRFSVTSKKEFRLIPKIVKTYCEMDGVGIQIAKKDDIARACYFIPLK